jgi:hypothetical protein
MITIDIINPRFSKEQLKVPTDKPSGLVYLPADFYSLRVSMRRLWMKPKVLRLMLVMNPIGLRPHIVKELPEYTKMEVSEDAVGEAGVPLEEREHYITKLASKIVLQQYKTFIWAPEMSITEHRPLYIAVYLYRGEEDSTLFDTYSGKKIPAGKPMFRGGPLRTDSSK